MNERWNELIKQAIQEVGFESRSDKEETLKRYAELIIEECIDICKQTHETPSGKMRCVNDDESIRKIREHFGVK